MRLKYYSKLLFMLITIFSCSQLFAGTQLIPDNEFRRLLKEAIESKSEFKDRFDAQVWLLDMSSRLKKYAKHISIKERMAMLKAVHREATRAGLSPQLVLAVIQTESNFDRFALSKVGARGLMQIMPFWINEIGRIEDNLFDINTNLRYGCAILRIYLDREKNNIQPALARYNGAVKSRKYSSKVLHRLRDNWFVGI